MLGQEGIKVPNSITINKKTKDIEILLKKNNLIFPLVVKPGSGAHGNGVSVNIHNVIDLKRSILMATKYSDDVLIQEFFRGNDYRIIIVNNKFIAAMQRVPAYIVGNGKDTIKKLLNIENKKENRGIGHEKALSKIPINKELKRQLFMQGLNMNHILNKGKKIYVRQNANLSTGGVSIDATDQIHPEIIKTCIKASKILGLKVCGVDYMSENITKPLNQQKGGIIEINHTPGIGGHHSPFKGTPRNVAKEILKAAIDIL